MRSAGGLVGLAAAAALCSSAALGAAARLPPASVPGAPGDCDGKDVTYKIVTDVGAYQLGRTVDMRKVPQQVNGGTLWEQIDVDANSRTQDAGGVTQRALVMNNNQQVAEGLGLDLSLRIDFLGGLLSLGVAFDFMDRQRSRSQSVRIVYVVDQPIEVKKLTEELITSELEDSRHFDIATHVVTEVTTGVQGFFSLEISLDEDEDAQKIGASLTGSFNAFLVSGSATARAEFEKIVNVGTRTFRYDYVGDVPVESNPTSLDGLREAVESFRRNIVRVNEGRGVPKTVKLTPLCKLRTEPFKSPIAGLSEESMAQVVAIYDSLTEAAEDARELRVLSDDGDFKLPRVYNAAGVMLDAVTRMQAKFRGRMQQLLPLMQTEPPELDPAELTRLALEVIESPFGAANLKALFEGMRDEIKFFKAFLAEVNKKSGSKLVRMLGPKDAASWRFDAVVMHVLVSREDATAVQLAAMTKYLEAPSTNYLSYRDAVGSWYPDLRNNAVIRNEIDKIGALATAEACLIWNTDDMQACRPDVDNSQHFVVADYYSIKDELDEMLGEELTESTTVLLWAEPQSGMLRHRKNVSPTPWLFDPRDFETGGPTQTYGLVEEGKAVARVGAGNDASAASACMSRGVVVGDDPNYLVCYEKPRLSSDYTDGFLTCLTCGDLCLSGNTRATGPGDPILSIEPCLLNGDTGFAEVSSLFRHKYLVTPGVGAVTELRLVDQIEQQGTERTATYQFANSTKADDTKIMLGVAQAPTEVGSFVIGTVTDDLCADIFSLVPAGSGDSRCRVAVDADPAEVDARMERLKAEASPSQPTYIRVVRELNSKVADIDDGTNELLFLRRIEGVETSPGWTLMTNLLEDPKLEGFYKYSSRADMLGDRECTGTSCGASQGEAATLVQRAMAGQSVCGDQSRRVQLCSARSDDHFHIKQKIGNVGDALSTPLFPEGRQLCPLQRVATDDGAPLFARGDVGMGEETEGCIVDWVLVKNPCEDATCAPGKTCRASVWNGEAKSECVYIEEINACDTHPCTEEGEWCRDLPAPALDRDTDRECVRERQSSPGFELLEAASEQGDAVFKPCRAGYFQDAQGTECKPHRVVSCAADEVLEVVPSAVSDGRCKKCPAGTFPEPPETCTVGKCQCLPQVFGPVLELLIDAEFDRDVHRTEEFKTFMTDFIQHALILEDGKPRVYDAERGPVEEGGVLVRYQIVDDIGDNSTDFQLRIRRAAAELDEDVYNVASPGLSPVVIAGVASSAGVVFIVAAAAGLWAWRGHRKRARSEAKHLTAHTNV